MQPEIIKPLPDDLYKYTLNALNGWNTANVANDSLFDHLLLARDAEKALNGAGRRPTKQECLNFILESALKSLSIEHPRKSQLLQDRFFAGKNWATVKQENPWLAGKNHNHVQRNAVQQLGKLIGVRENNLRKERISQLESLLNPPSYDRLFGVDVAIKKVKDVLLATAGNRVATIVGIGGIGKTSLADVVTRHLLQTFYFEKVIWHRVDQETLRHTSPDDVLAIITNELIKEIDPDSAPLPHQHQLRRLHLLFKQTRYLVVIDNLESGNDLTALLSYLLDWSHPSAFLVTTRRSALGTTPVHVHQLQELGYEDSAELLRHQAQLPNRIPPIKLTDEHIIKIYETVGGNPLALKLIVGMLPGGTLDATLKTLASAKHAKITKMYQRIFTQAWSALSPNAQRLLMMVPYASDEGAEYDYLQYMTEFSDHDLQAAIDELTMRSLLEIRRDSADIEQSPRFGIHRLTHAYVKSDILGFQ